MKAFALSKPRTIEVKGYYRQYEPKDFKSIPVESLIVVLGGEGRILKEMIANEQKEKVAEATKTAKVDTITTDSIATAANATSAITDSTPDSTGAASTGADSITNATATDSAELNDICAFTEESLLSYPHFPRQLGRISTRLVNKNSQHKHEEAAPLSMQVQALRQAKPEKNHFRIALVNAFGTNLGDNIIGIGALRLVVAEMRKILPSVAIDILYGIEARKANIELVAHDDFIEQTLFFGPTVQDFGRYDAYFDFSELINYPDYHNIPPIDWYLWWMGLDPKSFLPEQKRNKFHLQWQAWDNVQALLKTALKELPATNSAKKVLFNPKSSVPLRSIPEDIAAEFALKLLNANAEIYLVIDQTIKIKHKRLLDLSAHINSAELFKALVAQVDGVITVNSFAPHVADAASVPCVQLCAVYPASNYPYYPYMTHISIPDAPELPAYKKCKVDEELWTKMSDTYAQAWKKLSVMQVLQALDAQMEKRQAAPDKAMSLLFSHAVPVRPFIKQVDAFSKFKHEKPQAIWDYVQTHLQAFTKTNLIKQGGRAILCGPGQSPLAINLAKTLGPEGSLELFEPRKLRSQLISSDALHHAVQNINFHDLFPMQHNHEVLIPAIDPYSETDVFAWGNLENKIAIAAKPLDDYNFPFCQIIFLLLPLPANLILAGSQKLLEQCRPVIAMAPLTQPEAAEACKLVPQNYTMWAESARPDRQMEHLLLLGIPAEKDITVSGFTRVER